MRINGEAPGMLAEKAKKLRAALIHYSTDHLSTAQRKAPAAKAIRPIRRASTAAASSRASRRTRRAASTWCNTLAVLTAFMRAVFRRRRQREVAKRALGCLSPVRGVLDVVAQLRLGDLRTGGFAEQAEQAADSGSGAPDAGGAPGQLQNVER
jgi:hypothetical protein